MSSGPTTGHTAKFRKASDDGRISSGLVTRNGPPVIKALEPLLREKSGVALEIGSGTGQHILTFAAAFPQLKWHPSEPDPVHRTSIDAWRAHQAAPTGPALDLDAASTWWHKADLIALGSLDLILSLNVIHISPSITATRILQGAADRLGRGGLVAFYGPFSENGAHTGDGNAEFDRRLRAENPDWGLRDTRDLTEIAQDSGLDPHALIPMPANNRLLVFCRP